MLDFNGCNGSDAKVGLERLVRSSGSRPCMHLSVHHVNSVNKSGILRQGPRSKWTLTEKES